MRILAVLILTVFLLPGKAQEVAVRPKEGDAAPIALTLTRLEVLEGRVIGLEMGQFEMLRDRCFPDASKTIRAQVEELNKLIQGHQGRLLEVERLILKGRNLDPAKYVVNWREGNIKEKEVKQK